METVTGSIKKSCLDCHYSRFAGFDRWCADPRNHKLIKNVNAGCSNWVDMFYKGDIEPGKLPLFETLKEKERRHSKKK